MALVPEQALRGWALRHEDKGAPGVAHLAGEQDKGQRSAFAVADHVELGVQAALRAPDRPWPRPLRLETCRRAGSLQVRGPTDIFRQGQVLNNIYEIEGVIGRGGLGEA
jgi:hypothetical protein